MIMRIQLGSCPQSGAGRVRISAFMQALIPVLFPRRVFDGQRFSRDGPNPARTGEPRESDQQVGDHYKQHPHREPSFSAFRPSRKSAQQLALPSELRIRHTRLTGFTNAGRIANRAIWPANTP